MPLSLVLMRSTPTSCPTIDLRLPGAVAFTTLRGCSDPSEPYDGFNACHYTGDSPHHVTLCREQMASTLGLDNPSLLILPRQTHSARIEVVDATSASMPLEGVDGLVTSDPSVAIGVSTADCVPILMSDPVAGVIAAVHSGWRGNVERIAARAVDAMTGIGASPRRIICVLGPYIHREAYEVGPELIEIFTHTFGPGLDYWPEGAQRPHLDLGRAVIHTLTGCGIPQSNISEIGICSYTEFDRVFSARKLGVASGRTLTVARLDRSNASI